jgi:RNA polymerase sigma-70 factor (ECF subfamily)
MGLDAPDRMLKGDSSKEQETAVALVRELRVATTSERDIFASLQKELRRIARAKMRHERSDHTLQPTALVNEAFIKIHKTSLPPDFWDNPSKALRLIAHAMEQILNDHADAHYARKRGGIERQRVPLDGDQAREFTPDAKNPLFLDPELLVAPGQSETVLAVRESLLNLRRVAPRQAEILQLQFYCGLTQEEIAGLVNLSVETIRLETRKAKAFLKARLQRR